MIPPVLPKLDESIDNHLPEEQEWVFPRRMCIRKKSRISHRPRSVAELVLLILNRHRVRRSDRELSSPDILRVGHV